MLVQLKHSGPGQNVVVRANYLCKKLSSIPVSHNTSVTDRQTDRQTDTRQLLPNL